MSTATIQLPTEIERLAVARAAAAGHANVSEYVRALILADAAEPISSALESHLLAALETPARTMTPADWNEKRRAL